MNKIEQLIEELCPQGVEFKALGEVAEVLNGYAFKSKNYCHNGIRIIRISDVQKGKMSDKDLIFYPLASENEIKRYILKENDLVMSLTGNVGRVAMLSKNDLPAGLNQRVACIRVKTSALTRYLFHFFDQISFETEAMSNATGGGQKNMSTTWLKKFQIPIPPLAIQKEIVKILDNFTRLEAELEAELEARKKQYEHYREELLTFGDDVEWKALGEVAKYSKERISFENLNEDNYVGVDNLLQNREGKTISTCVPKSGNSTKYCEKDILIGNIRPYLKKIWHADRVGGTNGDVLAVHLTDAGVSPRYLYQVLAADNFFEYNMQNAKGAKMPRGNKNKIMEYPVPIPPLSKQKEIVAILDKFDALVNDISTGLPAEITARKKQYEYYRNQLITFKPLDVQDAN